MARILKKRSFITFLKGFLLICLLLESAIGFTQDLFLIDNRTVLNEKQLNYLQTILNEPSTIDYDIIRINEEALTKGEVYFSWKNESYHFSIVKKVERDHDDYSWSGVQNGGFGRCNLVVNGSRLTAIFRLERDMLAIYPLGEGLHVLAFKTNEGMPDDCPPDFESKVAARKKAMPVQEIIPQEPEFGTFFPDKPLPQSENDADLLAGNCKMRIMVVYTDDVDFFYADIRSHIQMAIDDMNDAHDNSQVNEDVELARTLRVNYDESPNNIDTFLKHMVLSNDGIIDNIHDDRNLFDADVCVFMTLLGGGYCGYAYDIGASYSTAFCQVAASCAVGNHSFAHEIGHLHGCRHDTFVDPNSTPYAYGHGFVYLPNNWRTIMAYNNECDCSDEVTPCPPSSSRNTPGSPSCIRLQNWSTPDVNYIGVPMGSAALQKNERVIDETIATLAGFENYINNKVVYDSRTVVSGEEFDIMGNTSVTTTSTQPFTINSGAKGSFRAGTEITLGEGFHARSGAEFRAYLDNCTSLALTEEEASLSESSQPKEKTIIYHQKQVLQLMASPNPFQKEVHISYRLLKDAEVHLFLTDLTGIPIRTLLLKEPTKGGMLNVLSADWSSVPAGTYFLVIEADGLREATKLVKLSY